jgi:transcriptional regulator GlxA family with amidase domain
MDEAHRLLIQTDLLIQKIAERTGYRHLTNLNKSCANTFKVQSDQLENKKNGSIQDKRLSANLTRFII